MKRSDFLAGAGALLGSALVPSLARAASPAEAETIQQIVRDDYHVFYVLQDKAKYRAMLTDDYLLLENGELLDVAGDIALMPAPDEEYRRTDTFEFHQVRIQGDTAWTVYTLRSDITDRKHGFRHPEFLESMVLRRTDGRWLVALLHSTLIPPATK